MSLQRCVKSLPIAKQVLVGWKNRGVRGLQRGSLQGTRPRPHDPIPHWLQGKMVAAYRTALDAWLFAANSPLSDGLRGRKTGPTERQLDMFAARPKVAKRGRATDGSAS